MGAASRMISCRVWSPFRISLLPPTNPLRPIGRLLHHTMCLDETERSLVASKERWHTAMSSITASISFPRATAERSAVSPWVIAITVTLATFMELLDTSISNVSLPHIAGGLGISYDESTWVLTSYLVANAIILPMSAWLSRAFGRKRYYMMCVALFTASSFLCGVAPSLATLIVFRVLQGIGGGGLAPVEQAILVDTFPKEKLGGAFALFGSTVLIPEMLQTLFGYTATNAGLVLGPGAAVITVLAPFVVRIVPRVGVKRMLAFIFIPVSQLAYSYLPKNKNNKGSSLTNLCRNWGASFGISFVTTMLERRTQYHQSVLVSNLTSADGSVRQFVRTSSHFLVTRGASTPDAIHQAYGLVGSMMKPAGCHARVHG